MRRILPLAAAMLFAAILFALGWSEWPRQEAAPMPPVVADPTTVPATTTTLGPTTTTLPTPGIVPVSLPVADLRAPEWYGSLMALSAEEAWATLATAEDPVANVIGHLEAGEWTAYRLTGGEGRVSGLARGPDGTVWAATDLGLFSYDGAGWSRRFEDPVGGIAVGEDGSVWIGGRRDSWYDEPIRLWLARGDGGSWQRLDPSPEDPPVVYAVTLLAVWRGDQVWMVQRAGDWAEDDLMRFDGTALQAVPIPGVPDPTPDNGIPPVRAITLAADSDGDLWVAGYLAARPEQALVARFDGTTWTVFDWPASNPSGPTPRIDVALGPDGLAWFAFEGGLRSFDGTTWTAYREGRAAYCVDVAPDGTVWYTDAAGVHVLELP